MSDEKQPAKTHDEIISEVMDPCRGKGEHEWAAAREIERLAAAREIERLTAEISDYESDVEAYQTEIERSLRKENEKLVDECCQLKEGYTSIRVQFAKFTKTVGGAFENAFKEGFMEGWMDGKHGTSPDPSPVVDAAWEKSKHINFINMVDCGRESK